MSMSKKRQIRLMPGNSACGSSRMPDRSRYTLVSLVARAGREDPRGAPVGSREQVDDERVGERRDARVARQRMAQSALDLDARRIALRVHDARVRVPAFARELELAVGPAIELRPHL